LGFTQAPRYTDPDGTGGGESAAAGGGVVGAVVEGVGCGADVEVLECGADVEEELGAPDGGALPPQLASAMPKTTASIDTGAR